MKDFKAHFDFFKQKIVNKENFAFSRFSDGEMFILQNKELKLSENLIQMGEVKQSGPYRKDDFKHFNPSEHKEFRDTLVKIFQHKQKNYYKGISCSCCVGKENFDFQIDLHGGDDESLTWANLWVNSNYPLFIQQILPLFYSKKCIFVGNKNANIKTLPFIVKDFRVGYNAMVNDYKTSFPKEDVLDVIYKIIPLVSTSHNEIYPFKGGKLKFYIGRPSVEESDRDDTSVRVSMPWEIVEVDKEGKKPNKKNKKVR